MARQPRIDLPSVTQHIVQRGNNRLPCFLHDNDRRAYLHLLNEALIKSGCRLHAYVLMDNHVHLLATPPAAGALSQMMQQLGRRYVGQFNSRHGRTGTLWEGRYKACLVDTHDYLLHCYRYIELNPVRACITDDPTDWPWSSSAANCGLTTDALLTPHPVYQSLAATPTERAITYHALLRSSLDEATVNQIRAYLQQQRALGCDSFRAMVEAKTQRFAAIRPAHRPQKPTTSTG